MRLRQTIAALLPVLVAFALQWMLWPLIGPYAWFLFTAAVLGLGCLIAALHERARTERQAAAAALAASEQANEQLKQALREREVLTALVDNSSDFIGVADPDGKPVYVNPAGRQMVGLPADYPVETTSLMDYYPPDQRAYATDVMLKAAHEPGPWRGETWFRHWQSQARIPVSDEHFMIRQGETGRLLGLGTITRDITAVTRARADAAAAQERVELALKGADLAAWDWNIETGEVNMNRRWAEMRGIRPEDVRPHVDSWRNGIHPDDWPRTKRALMDHVEGRTPEYGVEYRAATGAGGWIWILDRGKVVARDETGRPLRMAGTGLDITERKHLEHELRLAEAKSSGILSISADAIISIDEDQRIVLFNAGAEAIFGYTRAEAIGTPLERLIPERLRSRHRKHVERFAAEGEEARHMGEHGAVILGLRKNGAEFPADAAISKLVVDGRPLLTVALRDISEQRRYENGQRLLAEIGAGLASSIEFDQTLVNVAQLAVRDFADVCIVDVGAENSRVRRVQVASRDACDAWACDVLMKIPLDRERPHLLFQALHQQRSQLMRDLSAETVARFAQSDDHLQALRALDLGSLIAVPLLSHGKLLGAVGFASKPRTRAYDQADIRLAEGLAQHAALSIENAQLYRAAQRAIALRDEVLRVVVHDLRNPLGVVLMQATALRESAAEPERRRADAIERAGTRMSRLIGDLLDVTRLEAQSLALDRACVPAEQLVTDCVEAERLLTSSASLELRLDLSPRLPEVWVDHDRVQQVLENLIGNAIKFTKGGGCITVGARARGAEVLFWVKDTGSGIPAADLPHLFNRFWQARATARHGAGLGLTIVKGIIEGHGGRIWVESLPGHGSTFFFTLPTAARSASWQHHAAPHRA